MTAIVLSRPVHYPESDGRPFAETQFHAQVMFDLLHTLGQRYADVPDGYVWGNMMFYYVEGNPKASVAPDVFLVHGVDKRVRRIYKLWEERPPSLVIEITSESTKNEDMKVKKGLYERLGIEEYFLFDPLGEYLRPRLQGYRLADRRYEPIPAEEDRALLSRTTGLRLEPEGAGCACGMLRPASRSFGPTRRRERGRPRRRRSGSFGRRSSACTGSP